MRQLGRSLLLGFLLLSIAATVRGQQPENSRSDSRERIGDNHSRLIGKVEIELGETRVYADEAELFTDEHRAVLTGNVVVRSGSNQISADRAEFDTETHLGTFFNASGFASLQPQRQRAGVGLQLPPTTGPQTTTVYFFGEKVEKVGPKKYRITNGGMSTCVQPTPRWDLHADTVVLNIDHYTVLRDAVLSVKGVPMFYLPVMYFSNNVDDRAHDIIIP